MTRQRGVKGLVALLVVGVLAGGGCAASTETAWVDGTPPPPPPSASIAVNYQDKGEGLSPEKPVIVSLTSGTINSVVLKTSSGAEVSGKLDSSGTRWTSSLLKYGTAYELAVSATGEDGGTIEQTSSFSTLTPKNKTLPYLWAWTTDTRQLDKSVNADLHELDGHTYGVGQPIVVHFDEPIKDKAAAERALILTTDRKVLGSWHWFSDREVRWRPKEYWPAGTSVTVEANVYGKDLGGGLYGQENVKASFKIGDKKIAIADYKTDYMKVYVNDVQVTSIRDPKTKKTYDISKGIPVSMGQDAYIPGINGGSVFLKTHEGPHYITLAYTSYNMSSCTFGVGKVNPETGKCEGEGAYDEMISSSMRISFDGEFVHLRDWAPMSALGGWNSSHGCVNVGPKHIYWFFDNFGPGDIVDVVGSGRKDLRYDGLGDWGLTWKQWWQGSALNKTEPKLTDPVFDDPDYPGATPPYWRPE